MSELTCYYYDEQHNRCKCYVNENLDELLAENAKLREEFTKMDQWHSAELIAALDENAKLRDMVHALLQCNVEDGDVCAKCDYRSPLHGGCMADVQADELGVEVDA